MKEYFEYKDGKSSNFWQIEVEDCVVDITSGKIGTSGRNLSKEFQNAEEASLYYKQQVAKKLKEGYNDPKVSKLTLEQTPYYKNNKAFNHHDKVEGIYYYTDKERILSYCKNYFYIWSKEGDLLDTFNFYEDVGILKGIFIRQMGNTSKFLFYVWKRMKDRVYIFDLENDCFKLISNKKLDLPFNHYNVAVDIDNQYIYLAYSNGLVLMDDELNTVKILEFPYENNIGAVINAHSQWVALACCGEGEGQTVAILDMTGKLVSEFQAKVTNKLGHSIMTFNKEGTQLYTLYEDDDGQTNVQVWNPQDGTLIKQMPDTKASGCVHSLSLLSEEKWLITLSGAEDITLWNVEKGRVEWTRKGQSSWGSVCFLKDLTFYQSVDNVIYKVNKEDEENIEVGGISSLCQSLFYDDRRKQLWVADNNAVLCYSQEGEIVYKTQAQSLEACFEHKGGLKLLVSAETSHNGKRVCSWLSLEDFEQVPFLEGYFRSIVFDEKLVVSYEKETENIKIWNHNGKLLKTIKINRCSAMYLLKDKKLLISNGKKNEIWRIDEGNLMFTFKEDIEKVKVHAHLPYFITAAKSTMRLWNGQEDTPLSVEILAGTVKEIISESFLDVFLIIDDTGRMYTFNPETLELKVLVHMNKPIDKAALSATGKLYAVTEELDLLELDLKEYLNRQEIELCSNTGSSCTTVLSDESLKKENILQSLEALNWDELSEEDFLKLRDALGRIAGEGGVGEAHYYFTERMLEQGAKLRHQFAEKQDYSSFAMSSDGKYLAVGTFMGEDCCDDDGSIQIWELATGRCVNFLKEYYYGIGWHDYPWALQWSPDNKRIGAAINTNEVASFNPFGIKVAPLSKAIVTNGWPSPPAWCWVKDSSHFAISCYGDSALPLCICETSKTSIYEDDAKWLGERKEDSKFDEDEDEEPEVYVYIVCHATKNGKLIYGYNNRREIYAITAKTGQLTWVLYGALPVEFSPLDDFFVYVGHREIQIADLNTGKVKESISDVEGVEGFEFAPNTQRYAAYGQNKITVLDYNKKVACLELEANLLVHNYLESELRSVRFNKSGDQIACLLEDGDIEVWSLTGEEPTKILSYSSTATGIYWGEALVGVGSDSLVFFKEDGTILHTCDKKAQVEAYDEADSNIASPLEMDDEDLTDYYTTSPLYPLKNNDEVEWLVAVETGVIVSACKDKKELDKHLSYTWKNKYAWPVSWRENVIYDTMEQAMDEINL